MGKVKLTFMTGISEIDSHRELFSQGEWDSLISHFRTLSQDDFMAIAISEIDSKMKEEIKGVEVIEPGMVILNGDIRVLDYFEEFPEEGEEYVRGILEEGKKKKKKHDK